MSLKTIVLITTIIFITNPENQFHLNVILKDNTMWLKKLAHLENILYFCNIT